MSEKPDEIRQDGVETFYALWHPIFGYYTEFSEEGVAYATHDLADDYQLYTESDSDRLKFHLIEYADRLNGFVLVEVKVSVSKHYQPKVVATLSELLED